MRYWETVYSYTEQDAGLIDRVDEEMGQILGNCSGVERQWLQQEMSMDSCWD